MSPGPTGSRKKAFRYTSNSRYCTHFNDVFETSGLRIPILKILPILKRKTRWPLRPYSRGRQSRLASQTGFLYNLPRESDGDRRAQEERADGQSQMKTRIGLAAAAAAALAAFPAEAGMFKAKGFEPAVYYTGERPIECRGRPRDSLHPRLGRRRGRDV